RRGRSTLMFGMCSPWLREYVRPDDPDLSRMECGAPEPRQNARAMTARALARRAAPLALAFAPFAIEHDRRLRVRRRRRLGAVDRRSSRTDSADVPRTGNHDWRA